MEPTSPDAASNSGERGSGDEEYDKKFQELQKYIPFLKGMMRKLEHSSDKLRAAQLKKMKNLYGLLTNPQKRLKLETLEKCEDVLNKLQEKLKGCFGPGKSCGKLDNVDSDQGCSSSAPQAYSALKKQSAYENESNNVPFLCDSDSKSTFTSSDRTSAYLPMSRDMDIPTSSRHENNVDYRIKDNTQCDATVSFYQSTTSTESVRPGDLESPSSPTHVEAVASIPPVCIPLERKEPLSALQESRERLKKIMTQTSLVAAPVRRDSFTQPSFTVCPITTVPEVGTSTPDNHLPALDCRPVTPSPYTGNLVPAPECRPVTPSPYTGNLVPAPECRPVTPALYTGNLVPAPECRPVTPSPYTGNLLPASECRPITPSSYTGNLVPAPEWRPVTPSLYISNIEPRMDVPSQLSSPVYTPDITNTPARSDVDPDFPFLKMNQSYLPVSKDSEFPYLKKNESYLPPAPSTPANNCDVTNRTPSMSLRAKLGQEIDVVHKVGVSTGGALRTLISKDDRKSIEKKEVDGEKGKTLEKQPVADIDLRRENTPSHVNLRRTSMTSTESAVDEDLRHQLSNFALLPKNEMGSHNVDTHNQIPKPCSPPEGRRNLVHPPLINDTHRPPRVPLLDLPPTKPTSSPLFSEPKPNLGLNDPYPPAKPDYYSRPQNNQRSHVVCSATPFAQTRPPPSRFQQQNRVLLPTPPSRMSSPWSNAGNGNARKTTAHQLGLRYSKRPNTRQNMEESRAETSGARHGIGHQQGRPFDSRKTLPEKDAPQALFTPDSQSRMRTNIPSETNSPNTFNRRECNPDVKARGGKDNFQERFRNTDLKKREDRDEKHDQERNKDRDRIKETSEKLHGNKEENFVSPLGRLYENVAQPRTGKGYGIQNFRIPKKKIEPPKTASKHTAPLQSPPITGNKIPVLESKPSAPLHSPPITGNNIPVLERRLSPLRDPRTVRGKSRPPSPVGESQTPGTPPVWDVDIPAMHSTNTNISSDFPFKSHVTGLSPAERLSVDNQRIFHERNLLENSRLICPSPETGNNQFRRSSRSPVDGMSRGRSRPRSPGGRRSGARSRDGSRSPYRSKSRGRSPWTGTRRSPERSKSRARSRPRSRTPERSKSRARSRPRSKTPERSKSKTSSRPGSRTPERSKSRGRFRDASRSPERRTSSGSPDGRKSRARSRARSKSRGRSRSTSGSDARSSADYKTTGKGSSPDSAIRSTQTKARSRSRERSISGRSTSQESHRTTDSGNYSNRSRRRELSSDRARSDRKSYHRRSKRRSRSCSRARSKIRVSSRDRRYRSSRSSRYGRGRSKSSSPRRRSSSRSRRCSREQRRSRSRSPSREDCVTDIKPLQTEVSSESKSSPTRAIKIEPDVSSTSDAQPVEAKLVPDDSKNVTSAQPAETANIDSSVQFATEPEKPSNSIADKVEDKLAALKDLLGNADLMKYLVEKNILNLSAVGNITSVGSEDSQTVKTESPNDAAAKSIPTGSVEADTPDAFVDVPKNTATETPKDTEVAETLLSTDTANADISKITNEAENSRASVSTKDTLLTVEETPLPKLVKAPKTKRSKKQSAKKPKKGGSISSAAKELVKKKPPKSLEKLSQPTQPRRRGKNELERLQEDIREMFISAEVVTATGQRTCRVRREAQEHGPKSRNSSSEKSRTDSDMDFRSTSRGREDESSKALNTSSESGRSLDTAEPMADDVESDDDDTPLNLLQRNFDVRSPAPSECSPVRPTSKKRKYNLIDSETESEVDDGRVSSCSVVIENIAPLAPPKEIMSQRALSRNMARRGKKTGFSNFGNRKMAQEDPNPTVAEESAEDVDKSLIDCNNIIDWPHGEEPRKLTRLQRKMRLTEQDGEMPKPSIPKSHDLSVQCNNSSDSKVVTPAETKAVTALYTPGVTPSENKAVTPLENAAITSPDSKVPSPLDNDLNSPTELLNETVPENCDLPTTNSPVPPSSTFDKTSTENIENDQTKADCFKNVLPATLIKSEPVAFDDTDSSDVQGRGQLDLLADCVTKSCVYSDNFVKCRHCSWKGKAVVAHYKCTHPEAEIDHARFPTDIAAKLYADSEKEGYSAMRPVDLFLKFQLSKQRARYLLKCVLCRTMLNPRRFAKHFSLHTGEYHFRCATCNYAAPSKEQISEHFGTAHEEAKKDGKRAIIQQVVHGKIPPSNTAFAYVCSLCNFFQLQKQVVENHVKTVHQEVTKCSIIRVAVSELIDMEVSKPEVSKPAKKNAAETEENTSEAQKENEPQGDTPPLPNDVAGRDLPEDLLCITQAHSGIIETSSISQEDVVRSPEVSILGSVSTQPKQMISSGPSAPTRTDADTNKAIDLSIFISSDPLKSQEQQIEEERLKKLKDAGETLRNRMIKPRTSILDLIAERINAPQDSLAATYPPENVPLGITPLPTLRATPARRANKSLRSMSPQPPLPADAERKIRRQSLSKCQDTLTENLDLNLPGNVPSLSAGELNSTVELMRKKIETPIIARNRTAVAVHQFRNSSVVDESITVATVFKMRDPNLTSVRVGDVEVRPGSDEGALYVCHGDKCIFTSSLPKLYVDHLATEHHRWRVRQTCSVCKHELEEEGDMVYAFNHIKVQHLIQEFPPERPRPARRLAAAVPLVRARRIPGDKLSTPGNSLVFKNPVQEPESTSKPVEPSEDDSAPFCRIENVVSLSSMPPPLEDEVVDVETVLKVRSKTPTAPISEHPPVPPATPLSPRALSVHSINAIEKSPESRTSAEEITPTSLAQLNPVQMNTSRTIGKVRFEKATSVAAAIHTKEKLRHFFKCTGRMCSYTTNIKANFVYHYSMHVAKESESGISSCKFEWNKCIYCGTEESSGSRLTEHMVQFHGECCFQCAYCLYRAAYQANVVFHQNISHSNEPIAVLECRRVTESPQIPKPTQTIDFYQCVQAPTVCREEFFFTEDFKYHLRTKHSDDKYICAACMSEFSSPDLLVLHCNVQHSIRTYHCLYCRKASETQKEMCHHLCYDHSEEALIVAARTRTGMAQSSSIEYGEFEKRQKIQTIRLDDENSNSPGHLMKLSPLTGGSFIVPSEETDDPKQDVAFDNERTKDKKTSSSKEVIVISDDDPTTDTEGCEQLRLALQNKYKGQPTSELQMTDLQTSDPKRSEERVLSADELVAKVMKGIENTGLVGSSLYRCGHTDCSYTADSMAQLKDHIYVCDFSRNSPSLICVHCSRVSKTVDSFIEHLRSHGLHRYSCGSCDARAATLNLIMNHMKKAHHFTECNVVPLHPLQKDPDTSLFTIHAKDVAVGKRRTKKIPKPVYYPVKAVLTYDVPFTDKLSYSPDDIHLLPLAAVFPKEYRCAICNYSNKVRCNLVRHLQQHKDGREASPIPVVNRVPHLERNNGEKMFDTMTNHAVSSNLPRRNSTTSAKELEELPKFVPEQARYACSVCSSVTSEDTLYLHLTTLHPELKEVGYYCPHCRERSIQPVPLDRNVIPHHLKMHDNTLYKCPYCNFHHYQRHHVQRHTQDKHGDQQQYYKTVREPESKTASQPPSEVSSEQSGQESADSEGMGKEQQLVAFECGICGWEGHRAEVLNHARTVHKMYNSLKCTSCEYGTNTRKNFALHFRKKHDGVPQQVIAILKKVVKAGSTVPRSSQEKRTKELPTPSWQLQKGHAKHVRGIMFEENGPKPRELEHGDFGEMSTAKRSHSSDHRDGPEPKKLFAGQSSKPASTSKDELFKYRCPKCSVLLEMTETQFIIHLLGESESSSWLCHLCNKASENFSCLVKHYAHEHMISDELFVMKYGLYDTKVTDLVNRIITKYQKARLKELQARSSLQDAGSFRMTRTSRSLASSPVAWTAGSPSESLSDGLGVHVPKKAKLQPSTPTKFLPAPSLTSPSRSSPSPANILTPGTLKKIMVVKPMSLPEPSTSEDFATKLLDDPEGLEKNIEEVEEDSKSNEEWERFEKPAEQHCSLCNLSYPSQEDLKTHIQMAHGAGAMHSPTLRLPNSVNPPASANRPYTCDHCHFTCKTKVEKRNHEMRHWLHKPFKCGHCDGQFVRESDAKKHSSRMHPDKPPLIMENEISASEQTFLPLQRKRKPEKSPSPAEKSEPPTCPNTPDSKTLENIPTNVLEENYEHVLYPTVYKCSHCARRNTSLRQLKIHWESNHRTEALAEFAFKYDKMDFSEVVNSKRPYRFRCGMCPKGGSLIRLSEHYKVAHQSSPIALRGCTEKVFQCGLCVCHFQALSYVSRHFERRHPSEEIKFEKITIDPDLEKRQYQCVWCNEVLNSLQVLAIHHDRFHCHLKPTYKEVDGIIKTEAKRPASAGNVMLGEDSEKWQGPSSSAGGRQSSKVKVRAVARKSTSKVRSVARKSTSTPTRACASNVNYMYVDASSEDTDDDALVQTRDGTSFYGRPTSPVDVKRVTCPIQCGPVVRRVNVATAAQGMDLHPVVVCVDISDSPPNSQPCDSSNPV